MTQILNRKNNENSSTLKFIPLVVYFLLIGFSYLNNSFEFNIFALFLSIIFLFEFFTLRLSKSIRNYWNNGKFDITNFLDNQCFFGLTNTLILFISGYIFSQKYFENLFISIVLLISFILIDRIIQAYICKNSFLKNCYPSCERFAKIFCYYTKEESTENDDMNEVEYAEKPLHALVISIRILLLSIIGISLYLILDEGSDIKKTITSSGIFAVAIGFIFRTQINSMLVGAKLYFRNAFHINDWIEVPDLNIDGIIREINSFSVVVENWDKTKTNIPIDKFSEYSFKNWQNLNKQQMRRIKRSILIDLNSVRVLTSEEIDKLKQIAILKEYLINKEKEINLFNKLEDNKIDKRITNLGTFRIFIEKYLLALQEKQEYGKIAPYCPNDIRVMVRQLEPNEFGLPLEIYTFASTTDWKKFEDIQSDLFDYLFVAMKDFHLKVFQLESKV